MTLDVFIERPTNQTTKYLLIFSLILIAIAIPLVIILTAFFLLISGLRKQVSLKKLQ